MYRSFAGLLCNLLFFLILTGCGGSKPQNSLQTRSEALGKAFTLKVGQKARFDNEGLTLVIRGVSEDSRCPEGATCVWEGNARVQVELTKTAQPGAVVDLDTSPRTGSNETVYLNYTIQLVSLAPNPRLDRAIRADEYVVGLLVSKQ